MKGNLKMDIDNINRDDLVKKIDSFKPLNKSAYDSAMNHMKSVLNNFIKKNNFENICEIRECRDVTRFEIVVKDDNGYSHDIDVNFEKDWHRENDDKRMLTFNSCSFGSFYASDMFKRNYLIVLGKLCEQMTELEKEMLNFDWLKYDEIQDKIHTATYTLQSYDTEVKNREFNAEKQKVAELIKEGSRIIIGEKYKFGQYNDNGDILKEPDVRTIERVGKKTVNISGMYHRVKMDDVVHKLASKVWSLK